VTSLGTVVLIGSASFLDIRPKLGARPGNHPAPSSTPRWLSWRRCRG